MSTSIENQLKSARKYAKDQQLAEAESAYRGILESTTTSSATVVEAQEHALYELAKLYQEHK